MTINNQTAKKLKKEFIFGYGSLTSEKGENIPVRVRGLKRGWYLNINQDKTMALVVIKDKNHYCNGVIIEVSKEKISEFDKREKGYERVLLKREDIETIINKKILLGDVWVYTLKKPEKPKFFIIQSYLDIVLTGYLNINKNFTEEFLKTTYDWTKIENDRKNPRYPRYKKVPREKEIDKLIKKFVK